MQNNTSPSLGTSVLKSTVFSLIQLTIIAAGLFYFRDNINLKVAGIIAAIVVVVIPAIIAIIDRLRGTPKWINFLGYALGWWRIDWFIWARKWRAARLWEMLGYEEGGKVTLTRTRSGDILRAKVPGLDRERLITDLKKYLDRRKYATITPIDHEGRTDFAEVFLWRTDPLRRAFEITTPDEVVTDTEAGRIQGLARDDFGQDVNLDFSGVSGMLVAGMSGSGKTLSLISGLFPYFFEGAKTGETRLFIADGKGGGDWSALAPLALNRKPGEVGITELAHITGWLCQERRRRVDFCERVGVANGWNLPRKQMPHFTLIVDECQLFLSQGNFFTKEEKHAYQQVIRGITELVKMGRSAAITVILITQKTDGEAIPTQIRDIAQLRVSFRQPNRVGSELIFGTIPEDAISPHELPARMPGLAVVLNDRSEYTRCRFNYITDSTARNWREKAMRTRAEIALKTTQNQNFGGRKVGVTR